MKTKKEIKAIYQDCTSRNYMDDSLINDAIGEIGQLQAQGYDVRMTQSEIIDRAYDLQDNI